MVAVPDHMIYRLNGCGFSATNLVDTIVGVYAQTREAEQAKLDGCL